MNLFKTLLRIAWDLVTVIVLATLFLVVIIALVLVVDTMPGGM